MSSCFPYQYLAATSLLITAVLASGCATTVVPTETSNPGNAVSVPWSAESEVIPVVRHGRYTLVELAPTAAQRDLLMQIVDMTLPDDTSASVADGLRQVLKHSGYRLCQTTSTNTELFALPLPAAHRRLGPMTLRDALLTLAGPAWELQVYETTRVICFTNPQSSDIALSLSSIHRLAEP
ncbi:type IV pili sensor histidine kinase and response regulator [Halopseudomonas litoralis]|uniref:Type IV pili sensor histidine kinase and response regulator n=1 Tax=Halopseudomonas litoralis TaxID=797277 RepID=A0A1H1Q1R4_9GAMM|nr:type IV pili sensor histidine kinase and response regulator [Halopseudomonas litoralis]